MQNLPHNSYHHIVMIFIEMISLFQLINNIVSCFNVFLVFLIYIYSNISYDIYLNHIIVCILLFILCAISQFSITWIVCILQCGTSRYNIFIKTSSRSLKAEDMWGPILAEILFVSRYICNFVGTKLNRLSSCYLDYWRFPDEVLGIEPIWTNYTFI